MVTRVAVASEFRLACYLPLGTLHIPITNTSKALAMRLIAHSCGGHKQCWKCVGSG